MSKLQIVHRTGFRYNGGAAESFNEARMVPLSNHEQEVLHSDLLVTPDPWRFSYTDHWGSQVTSFQVYEQHDELSITATSLVDVARDPSAPQPRLSWAEVTSPEVADDQCEFLGITERVAPPADLAERVAELRTRCATPAEFAWQVCQLVHHEVRYVTGSTSVHSHASEAWEQRAGVCQDMAHLVIGALRSQQVPARYVSGYVVPSKVAEQDRTYPAESHAWVQYYDGAWCGVDPTNDVRPGELHVEVATGRDYLDVPPLKGIFSGGSTSDAFVEVEITVVEAPHESRAPATSRN